MKATIRQLKEEIRALNKKVLQAEQEMYPLDVKHRIHELENSLVSEWRKNMVNEQMFNFSMQLIKSLQEELDEARKIYEDCEKQINEMKTKLQSESATEVNRKKIKDLEDEVQQLRNINKELADQLATKERMISVIFGQTDALNKETNNLSHANKHSLKGKTKINPYIKHMFKSVTGTNMNILSLSLRKMIVSAVVV
jgi:predicted  nucleic acid-binding Zn-ribbon protein